MSNDIVGGLPEEANLVVLVASRGAIATFLRRSQVVDRFAVNLGGDQLETFVGSQVEPGGMERPATNSLIDALTIHIEDPSSSRNRVTDRPLGELLQGLFARTALDDDVSIHVYKYTSPLVGL